MSSETVRENSNATIRESQDKNATVRERQQSIKLSSVGIGSQFRNYNIIRQLPSTSTEADIFVIQKENNEYILKLYRYGIEPKVEILKAIWFLSKKYPKEFVNVFLSDYDANCKRWFEIQEYIKNGSLQTVINNISKLGKAQRKAFFNYTAKEVGRALSVLHENNLLHLDLKPSNILIRSIKPFNLVLIDFGISTLLASDMSKKFTRTRGTPMYQSPESWAGSMNRASDWWGLGMILLEIASGKHPFSGLDCKVIASAIATLNVEIPQNIDEEQQEILRGLLTRDPDKRWKWEQVYRWLKGERNITTFFEADTKNSKQLNENMKYVIFMGKKYDALNKIAAVFAQNEETWEKGRAFLMRGYVTRWLEEVGNYDDVANIDVIFGGVDDSDIKTFRFIDSFGENVPFVFCGHLVTPKNLLLITAKSLKRENLTAMEKKFADSVSDGVLLSCSDFFLKKHEDSKEVSMIKKALQNLKGKSLKDTVAYLDFYVHPENYYCPFIKNELNFMNAVVSSCSLQCVPLKLEEWQKLNMNEIVPDELQQKMKSADSYHEFFIENYLNKMIIRAVKYKNYEVMELLREYAQLDINYVDEKGNTLIAQAVINNNYEAVEALIAIGANVNVKRASDGGTPLMFTILNDAHEIAKLLIDNGANVNGKSNDGSTPLMLAAKHNAYEIAKLLMENGANINDKNNQNAAALIATAFNDAYEIAKLLIDSGANVNEKSIQGITPLIFAAHHNAYKVAKLLIARGADINDVDNNGNTPLVHARLSNANEIATLLIENGANTNRVGKNNDNISLMQAVEYNDYELVKRLIESGANVNEKDNDVIFTNTPLTAAVYNNYYEIAKLLIDNGADVNKSDDSGDTPLTWARRVKAYEIYKLLVINGANINEENKDGNTPLIRAIHDNDYKIAKFLIDNGVNINEKDKNGRTPFMLAINDNNYDIAKFLVKNGANINEKDDEGDTSLMQAVLYNHYKVAKFLIENGANVNEKYRGGHTLLTMATYKDNYEIAKLLIDNGSNVNEKGINGCTPLMEAVSRNNYKIAELLINKGASFTIKNHFGETVLDYLILNNETSDLIKSKVHNKNFFHNKYF